MVSPVKILRENFRDLYPPKIVQPVEADLRVEIQNSKKKPRAYWRWKTPKKFSPHPNPKKT
jgi:hypothetical protein